LGETSTSAITVEFEN
jgi:hypothetical protein